MRRAGDEADERERARQHPQHLSGGERRDGAGMGPVRGDAAGRCPAERREPCGHERLVAPVVATGAGPSAGKWGDIRQRARRRRSARRAPARSADGFGRALPNARTSTRWERARYRQHTRDRRLHRTSAPFATTTAPALGAPTATRRQLGTTSRRRPRNAMQSDHTRVVKCLHRSARSIERFVAQCRPPAIVRRLRCHDVSGRH